MELCADLGVYFGITGVQDLLAEVESLSSAEDVFALIGRMQTRGLSQPIAAYVSQDRKQSSRYVPGLSQSGLTMPDREYYLSEEARYADLRTGLLNYVRTLLELSGVEAQLAAMLFRKALHHGIHKRRAITPSERSFSRHGDVAKVQVHGAMGRHAQVRQDNP